jgi:alpha-tubulin suppressor-like RCC1 family protein
MGFLGQLGNGTNVMTQSTPVDVSGLTQVTSLSGGGYGGTHICAVRSDNSLWCWGRNDSSQSGIVRDYSAIDLSNAF